MLTFRESFFINETILSIDLITAESFWVERNQSILQSFLQVVFMERWVEERYRSRALDHCHFRQDADKLAVDQRVRPYPLEPIPQQ